MVRFLFFWELVNPARLKMLPKVWQEFAAKEKAKKVPQLAAETAKTAA